MSVRTLPAGSAVTVRVPATSANLGPGFDALGIALDWVDHSTLEVLPEGVEVEVSGEGEQHVPHDRSHLVVRCLDLGLDALDAKAPGVRLRAHNTIPHTRGLGSSAAATVAGLAAAWALARPGEPLDRQWLLELSTRVEGHADNVAAAIFGGYAMTWIEPDGTPRSAAGVLHPELCAVAHIPENPVSTRSARRALPELVPHGAAAANSGRAALLSHALAQEPELLAAATREWLHQQYRADLMPESYDLVQVLREQGFGAFISGAGPTVLVLTPRSWVDRLCATPVPGFRRLTLAVGTGVELV